MNSHPSSRVEFLATMVTLEMLGTLVRDQDLFVFKVTLAVPRKGQVVGGMR